MTKEIYVDNSATTFMDDEILNIYLDTIKKYYGNPSSLHQLGVESERLLKEGRKIIAQTLGVSEREIYFTSGGTESNNLAIHGTVRAYGHRGKKLITSSIEHPSVLEVFKDYQRQGYNVVYLDVDEFGFIDLEQLEKEVDDDTILVSIMLVNNEIGTLQDIVNIGRIIKEKNRRCIFHVDAVQGYGKVELNVVKANIDLLSISSHKFHGPKGVGGLYIKDKTNLAPIFQGGGQQQGIRSGTENVPGYYAMAKAAEKMFKLWDVNKTMGNLTNMIKEEILKNVKDVMILTPEVAAPHIMTIAFRGLKGEVLLHSLESKGIFLSTGSACSSKQKGISHVLKAINLPKEYQEGAIRISLSRFNNEEEIKYLIQSIITSVEELKLFI
ncbi:cysteine desulfurase family protein [Anaerobranca gottschalkii]|uniref:Cysteine desulfurase n=1 Tax=Anaerobranca gottschalkii DSM 13577 TaxID=1120990 RepID=A0A1I0CNK7_9FIRM|nr:cysteine desulfurase family protein [Anaerobranca gottschalkii]SET20593.1 cysteine desulfurase [Anaerobranca gottschalkii DSM 13577]